MSTFSPDSTAISMAEVVASLSIAADLGMGQPLEHTLRTCIVAVRLADALGLGESAAREVYYVALLRPVGCTATAREAAEVLGDELDAGRWFASVDEGHRWRMLATVLRHVGAGEPAGRRAAKLATALVGMPSLLGTVRAHCEVAQAIAARLGLADEVSLALGQVFERWDGRGAPAGLKGSSSRMLAKRCSCLPIMCVQVDTIPER
jgi:HD domain